MKLSLPFNLTVKSLVLCLSTACSSVVGDMPHNDIHIEKTPEKPMDAPVETNQEIASSLEEENDEAEANLDPLEPLNRLFFGLNEMIDFLILRPVAEMYRAVTPEMVQNGVTNVLDNLFSPVNFLNHVLQGNPEKATVTLFRFFVNSTFGIGGMVDVTSDMGYPRYDTDFNQTLITWNVQTGPYLVLPLIGSASFRGAIGYAVDYYVDPLNLYLMNDHTKHRSWLTIRYGVDMVNRRAKVIETLDNLRKSSPDLYVTLRSIYFQKQNYIAEKLKSEDTQETLQEEKKSVS